MSLILQTPQSAIDDIVVFLKSTFEKQHKTEAVIAVSGGIDSALSLTLLAKTLPKNQIWPIFLPFGQQSMADAQTICDFLKIPKENWQEFQIEDIVVAAQEEAKLSPVENNLQKVRFGNLMARARMMLVYDFAKSKNALVCGTENKSEHYLGYFTRFGDAASDIEPICDLYKTHVRQLVSHLHLPGVFLEKPPSAGLWSAQTDEQEMGFSYEIADQVLFQLIDQQKDPNTITIEDVRAETIQKVIQQVEAMRFKLEVPYMPKRKD